MNGSKTQGKKPGLKDYIRRYAFAAVMAALLAALAIFFPRVTIGGETKELGVRALEITLSSFKEMLFVIPPVFLMLGLLDVWVPRETMVKYMGEGSGLRGAVLAVLLGSAAAGPLYAAFPVAAVFMKKGARFFNVVLFMGAWSTTKIPMLLFELSSMGPLFTLTRLGMSLIGITLIAFAVNRFTGKERIARIYENAMNL
jgi:uncharacterized membrane protein YraQ (UPF0718 family)